MSDQLHLELELIQCPKCGFSDVLDGFDCIGACGANVFCVRCHCEFDPDSRVKHDGRSCPTCKAVRREVHTPHGIASMTDYMRRETIAAMTAKVKD